MTILKLLVSLLILSSFSFIQGQDLKDQIDSYVESYVNTGDFSGCILIEEGGEVIYKSCFGYANASFKVENTTETKFKIGSVSKQFTATAILLLQQDSRLKLSDTLSNFFPNYPVARNITIEHLLTHTSGLIDVYSVKDFNKLTCENMSISELSEMVLSNETLFDPGSQYQYSNGGYAVLAALIEKLSGMKYQDFMVKRIFKPLNMGSSGHAMVNEVLEGLAEGYDPSGYDGVKRTDLLDPELLKGSGSLYSSVTDLLNWVNSIRDRKLLSSASYDMLLNDYGHSYGLGISVYSSFENEVFGHDGRVNGYIADYLHYVDRNMSIIVLGNIQTGVSDFFRADIASMLFEKEYSSSAKNTPHDLKTKIDYKDILGVYSFGPNFKVYVELIDDVLHARANEGGASEIVLLEDGSYFSRTLYSYIEFVPTEDGEISKMVWTNNDGVSFEGLKD
ncbi:MAG: serine hydrolase [Flavobacteriales bacterium]|nr:serine hydrolase [Flavobacteriales bacterium]NNK81017.1 serine hydrolase [Flavobacteriales bacterium]